MPAKASGHAATSRAERLVVARREILLHGARQLRRLLPLRARLLDRVVRPSGAAARLGGLLRHQRLELADHRFARRRLLLQLNLVAVLVAIEEPIARGAEALPDRLRLRLPHRTDRLPLGLQLLQLRRRCSHSVDSASASASTQSASLRARLAAHSSLRCLGLPDGA